MKLFTKKELLPFAIIVLVVLVGIVLHSSLPERVPSHWNAKGEIDAWSSKDFSVIFLPLVILGIYLLMTFIPLIDPLRKNYEKFALPYFCFRTVFVLFFALLYFYTLWTALGGQANINHLMLPAFSFLFIVIGAFLPHIKKNYFVGIRTPWTLHSEEVWNETHKVAGKLFIAAGIVSLSGFLFSEYSFHIFMTAVLGAALGSVFYSYFVFRRMGEFNKNNNN